MPDAWLSRHTYALGDIKQVINELCAVLEKRQPPPTATQHEMLTKKFWPLEEGRAPQLTPKQQTNKAIHLLGSAANERTMDNVHTHRSRNTLP